MAKPFLLCALWYLALCGCAGSAGETRENSLNVYASFYAMYDFTRSIGGDRIQLTLLAPAGVEPHDWEPSAKDMAELEKADILVYNGAGMEPFLSAFQASVQNENLLYAEASSGIELLEADPHVWLDPRNAKREMENIKNALCEKQPADAEYFEANYQQMSDKLDALFEAYKNASLSFARKDLVVAHEAYGYLCAAFGLTQVPIEGLAADGEPTPARMAEIIQYISAHQITAIFTEELINPKAAGTIAAETGVAVVILSPFESGTSDYITVMEENLRTLTDALR
jgi:zinc transport system substrate-binding protein